ncbi:mitotic fidelity of chromosome transmission- protein [Fusarium falciforme]
MAPPHRENRESSALVALYELGVRGRKTGLELVDTGERDEFGMQPLDGLDGILPSGSSPWDSLATGRTMNDNDAIREPSPTVQHMGIETTHTPRRPSPSNEANMQGNNLTNQLPTELSLPPPTNAPAYSHPLHSPAEDALPLPGPPQHPVTPTSQHGAEPTACEVQCSTPNMVASVEELANYGMRISSLVNDNDAGAESSDLSKASDVEAQHPEGSVASQLAPAPLRKRRGRPPKARKRPDETSNHLMTDGEVAISSQPPGQESSHCEDIDQNWTDSEVTSSMPPSKRRRLTAGEATRDINADRRELAGKREPKRRGRPRRDIQAETLAVSPVDKVVKTRAGRVSYKPLRYWRGDKVVTEKQEFDDVKGRGRFVIGSTKEVIRGPETEFTTDLVQHHNPSSKRKTRHVRQRTGVDPQDWELNVGSVRGQVIKWKPEYRFRPPQDGDPVDTDSGAIAMTADAITEGRGQGPLFRSFLVAPVPFLNHGLLKVYPHKTIRRSNTLDKQIVFFLHRGTLSVEVHRSTFKISPGGTWIVPRGLCT